MEASAAADYMVGVTIGQGSFGTVVHARHKQTGREVAIKVFDKASLQKHPPWLRSVLHEQKLLRRLSECSYIVDLLASFHDDHCVYMVLECCKGGDLTQVIPSENPDDKTGNIESTRNATALHYGWEILQAIEALHAQHIIHADLKPENILLDGTGKIRLADFGSAVDLADEHRALQHANGTAAYAAPEVIRACPDLTMSADLWSFGCILHALWAGRSPFQGETEALSVDQVLAWCRGDECPNAMFSSRVPADWKEICAALLRSSPSDRIGANGDYSALKAVWENSIAERTEYQKRTHTIYKPDWLIRSKSYEMRNGNLGWAVFLL